MASQARDLFVAGWRRGYRRGYRAALDKAAHQVDNANRASLNVPVLDAENEFEDFKLAEEREARTSRECAK